MINGILWGGTSTSMVFSDYDKVNSELGYGWTTAQ